VTLFGISLYRSSATATAFALIDRINHIEQLEKIDQTGL
jgi:hypothetical protein